MKILGAAIINPVICLLNISPMRSFPIDLKEFLFSHSGTATPEMSELR